MKGIILAGGTGSRLHPITLGTSKQLLPVYDKPMVYYPLATLMTVGIREVLIITTPQDRDAFERLLGDGSTWGIAITYAIQDRPEGLPQAFIIGADFVGQDSVALILGDNIFHAPDLGETLNEGAGRPGGHIFAHRMSDPRSYGVVELDSRGGAVRLEEKPEHPRSDYAVTGLYFFDNQVIEIARTLRPSARGELEILDVSRAYLDGKNLSVTVLPRGTAWFDAGTFEGLMDASQFVSVVEKRQGYKIGCVEEIAWRASWIDDAAFERLGIDLLGSGYGDYILACLAHEKRI